MMKTFLTFIALAALFLAPEKALTQGAPAGLEKSAIAKTWRIMPLGDSITKGHTRAGSTPPGGFRDDLAALLDSEGVLYDFVGSQIDGTGFDADHEGHSGMRADFIDENVTTFLQAQNPDVVLLHIGTNDISEDQTPESTAAEIAVIIDKIRNYNSQIRVVLCSTIPRQDSWNSANDILALLIEEIYYAKRNAGARIFYAGQHEVFTANPNFAADYLFNDQHPNNTGYQLMAEVYLNALMNAVTFSDLGITDNFNRLRLGKTWVADAEYAIANNRLRNTATNSNWEYLAVYVGQINPTVVSMKWSPNANASGVGNGGLALRLDGPATNANGYLAYIASDANLCLWTITNGVRSHQVQTASSAAPAPQPGDKFHIAMSSNGYGHHFDFYLNDQFAGRLTDAAKEFGNAGRQYAGIFLRGNANNDVDDFSLEKTDITTPEAFSVTAPNGGESWLAGSANIITWTPRGDLQQVNIEISYNNGAAWTAIANSIQNTGAYAWLAPNITSPACRVRISDAVDGDPTDVSDATFSILTSGGAGHALQFDGVDDVARIPDNALLSGGSGKSMTVEAWVRLSSVQGNNPIIQKFADASHKDWGLAVDDGILEISIENDGDNWEYEAGAVAAGAWTHLAFTFDNNANVVHLYVNGMQMGAGAAQPKNMPDTEAPILLGGHAYLNRHIMGIIDEVRMWNYARSAAALRDDMNRLLQGNEPGLIGYWRFDEGAGQLATDLTANNHAILRGAANASEPNDPAWVLSDAPLSQPNMNSFSFTPVHDAYVRLSSPGQSYAAAANLIQREASNEAVLTYLKFNITGIGWPVLNAKLRLYVTDSSDDGGTVYPVSNHYQATNTAWTEGGLTWNNAPIISGAGLSAAGAVSAGNWIELDVTSAISSNGVYSFGLKNNSSNAINYSSKEGNHAPELVITTGMNPPPAPTITSFIPSSGCEGIEITITGTNLGEATEVTFNETAATNFTIASSSEIRANVPVGATTGSIRVTAATGEAVSDLNFTVTPPPVTVAFNPIEDAEVKSSTPTTNYGHYGIFRLRDGSVKYYSYLKFNVTGLDGAVQRARLRLYVTEGGDDGGAVYSVPNNYHSSSTPWDEGGITWNNAPAISGSPLHTIGAAVSAGTWLEFDVTAAIAGDGIYSFGLRNQSTSTVKFNSKEGSNRPELVIEINGASNLITTVRNPNEDAEVKSSSPTANYGGYGIFRLRGGSVQYKSFLKFHLTGIDGAVQHAKLRLYVTEGSDNGGTLYSVSNNYQSSSTPWEEEGINWNNAPATGGASFGSAGAVSVGSWVQWDVTSAISGDGVYSFGISSSSTSSVKYSSKEGANPPELVILTASGSAPARKTDRSAAATDGAENRRITISTAENVALYPNPLRASAFHAASKIVYELSERSHVKVAIYDLLGRELNVLVDEVRLSGTHEVRWNGRDANGLPLPSGLYIYAMQAGHIKRAQKVMIIR